MYERLVRIRALALLHVDPTAVESGVCARGASVRMILLCWNEPLASRLHKSCHSLRQKRCAIAPWRMTSHQVRCIEYSIVIPWHSGRKSSVTLSRAAMVVQLRSEALMITTVVEPRPAKASEQTELARRHLLRLPGVPLNVARSGTLCNLIKDGGGLRMHSGQECSLALPSVEITMNFCFLPKTHTTIDGRGRTVDLPRRTTLQVP
nr:hypothetical protein CFP56_67344 [Quercus suber]